MLPNSVPPFSLAGLRAIFDRWKRLLGLAVGLAAVVSIIVVLLMPNIYSSTAIFLPTSPQSSDPDRLVEGAKLEIGVRTEDLDRVLTIGQSLPMAELMIRKFDLYHHYDIGEPGTDVVENKALSEFTSNFTIVHNERDAIELTVQDEDKKLAAKIANAMMAAIDSVNQQLTLVNRRNVLDLYRQRTAVLGRNYAITRQRLISARRRYGIFGLEQQGRYLGKAVIDTEKELRIAEAGGPGNVAGLRRALHALTSADGGNAINLEGWTQGSDSVSLISSRLADIQGRYVGSQAAYEQAETSLRSRGVSSLYLVQKAYPATRKSKPLRTVIVLGSVLITLALSVFLILLLELYRRRPMANTEVTA